MTEFSYKGRTIAVTTDGSFKYQDATGTTVSKSTLKAAKAAIDKEVGQVIVPAMTMYGKKIELLSRHRSGGYVDAQGYRIRYTDFRPWREEAAAKLAEIQARRDAEVKRHNEATDSLRAESRAVVDALGPFDFEAPQKAVLEAQKRA